MSNFCKYIDVNKCIGNPDLILFVGFTTLLSKLESTTQADLTFVQPVRDPVEDLPGHAVPRHADHRGPRVLSRARVTCHVSSWVSPHLLEVDVVAVHHDQAPAPGPGRVLQPRVLGRGHAQPHQGVRGARGGGLHLIVLANFRGNIYIRYLEKAY